MAGTRGAQMPAEELGLESCNLGQFLWTPVYPGISDAGKGRVCFLD